MTKSGGALRSAEQGMNKRCSCCSGSRPNSAIVTHQVHPRLVIEFDKSKKEPVMVLKSIVTAAIAVTIFGTGAILSTSPARAQDAQAELLGFHQLCDRGDRKACVRFGMILGRMQERHAEWRRMHPEWFWWER
jgi:hypothetical protein